MSTDTTFLDAQVYARRATNAADVLRAWHDDHHTDPADYCMGEPCATVWRELEYLDSLANAGADADPEITATVRAWHDRHHHDPHATCAHALCTALRLLVFERDENQGSLL